MNAAEAIRMPPGLDAPMVEHALFVATLVPVHPLHHVRDDGTCSCRKAEPCKAGKHPAGGNGWQARATCDETKIRAMWKQFPLANVGIRTDGFVVLDADGEEGCATLATLDLPPTFTVRTGGGGLHAYFTRPAGIVALNSVGKLGPKLDVRTNGGNLVGPGSNHVSGRRYVVETFAPIAMLPASVVERLAACAEQKSEPLRVAPTVPTDGDPEDMAVWLPKLLAEQSAKRMAAPEASEGLPGGAAPAGKRWQTIEEALTANPFARRVERAIGWVKRAAPAVSGEGGGPRTMGVASSVVRGFALDEESGVRVLRDNFTCVPPWNDHDLRRKVQEALRVGKFEIGAHLPELVPIASPAPEATPCDPSHPLASAPKLRAIALLGRENFLAEAAKPIPYVWRGIATAAQVVALNGKPAGGKTSLLFLIAVARAQPDGAISLLGYEMKSAPAGQFVVIVEAEQSAGSSARKLVKSVETLRVSETTLDRIVLIARKGVLLGDERWAEIVSLVRDGKVSDVFVDSLARVAPGDSNDEKEQAAIFGKVHDTIEAGPGDEATKPIVWVVTHAKKGNGEADVENMSGSQQRAAQTDTILEVTAIREDDRIVASKVVFTKLREEPDPFPDPVQFTIAKDDGGRWGIAYAEAIGKGPDLDDDRPLETQIEALLAREDKPQTAKELRRKLSRSAPKIQDAISLLFAAKRIRATTKKTRTGDAKAFELRPLHQEGTPPWPPL